MIVELQLPDELWQRLRAAGTDDSAKERLKALAARFADLPLDEKILVLRAKHLEELYEIFRLDFKTGGALTAAVRNLVTVTVKGVRIQFSEEVIQRLRDQWEGSGVGWDEFVVERIKTNMEQLLGVW